uniref:Uncharacterized protein n=1 Tax=Glossina brevipalpis TaxID=37001 RepID=A0A1A9WV85_9MUSC
MFIITDVWRYLRYEHEHTADLVTKYLQHPMVVHVYHPYRQPDGENYCQTTNGHCSHLCLPAPHINERSPRISCACPTGLNLMEDGQMCAEDLIEKIDLAMSVYLSEPMGSSVGK